MSKHVSLGAYGERCICRDLEKKGYVVVGRNIRVRGAGEVDVAAKKGKYVHCIEVKTTERIRREGDVFSPLVRVNHKKRQGLMRASMWFVNSRYPDCGLVCTIALVYIRKPVTWFERLIQSLFKRPVVECIEYINIA